MNGPDTPDELVMGTLPEGIFFLGVNPNASITLLLKDKWAIVIGSRDYFDHECRAMQLDSKQTIFG